MLQNKDTIVGTILNTTHLQCFDGVWFESDSQAEQLPEASVKKPIITCFS